MAKSTAKVILFARVTHDKKVTQWPVAVFNAPPAARTYATMIAVAHKSGDVETAKAMDPNTAVDADGRLVPGLKFSMVEVAYEPEPAVSSDDLFDTPAAPTT